MTGAGDRSRAAIIHDNAHWWIHRGPKDDQEREELLGRGFEPNVQLEGFLIVQQRHPAMFDMLPVERRAQVRDYAARRAARLRFDRSVRIPEIDVEAIDRAAQLLEHSTASGHDISEAMDLGRDGFRAAVAERRWTDVMGAWVTWLEGLAEAHAQLRAVHAARRMLGLNGADSPPPHAPNFADELGLAMDALGRSIMAPRKVDR